MVLQLLRGEIRHGPQPGDIRKTRILERFDGGIATATATGTFGAFYVLFLNTESKH